MSDDNFKDFKEFMVAIVNFLQPIANGINRALKDPETIKVIEMMCAEKTGGFNLVN